LGCSGYIPWANRKRNSRKKENVDPDVPVHPSLEIVDLLKSKRKPNRLLEVYRLLLKPITWVSAEDLNKNLRYVKRTLQGTLNRLVTLGLVKKPEV